MKKVLWLLLATGVFLSCNSKQHLENKAPGNLIDTVSNHPENNAEEIALNNGARWKADEVTNNNVNGLKTIIDNFSKGIDKTLPAYQKAGSDLQKGLDKMINECRMKGADHEALHKWLQPLLKQVNEFRQSSTITGATKYFEAINKQVNRYYQFFE